MDPVVIFLFLDLCYKVLSATPPIPPYFADDELALQWNSFGSLFRLFLCSCIFGLPLPVPRLYTLLSPNFHGQEDVDPRDLFSDLERDPPDFSGCRGRHQSLWWKSLQIWSRFSETKEVDDNIDTLHDTGFWWQWFGCASIPLMMFCPVYLTFLMQPLQENFTLLSRYFGITLILKFLGLQLNTG